MRPVLFACLAFISACSDNTGNTPPHPDMAFVFPSGCANLQKDGDETDIDCGGSCSPCDTGKACNGGKDCNSGVCINKICAAASCSDSFKNGDETDTDCGGSCPNKCSEGQKCTNGPDCQSGTCANNVCTPSQCSDSKQDGMETDIDCGGPICMKCAEGKKCGDGTDCLGGTCVNNVCKSMMMASCNDGVKNGSETDIDCGGGTCSKCGLGKTCGNAVDCQSGQCSAGKCASANGLTLAFGGAVAVPTINNVNFNRMTAGDLNGDKNVDLVVTDNGNDKVLVLLGNGNGTLQPPSSYDSGGKGPYQPAISDFDGDGKSDLLVTNISPGVVPGVLALFPGKGDGTLNAASTIASGGGGPAFVVSGDWNKDGKIDFAVVNCCNNAENLSVFVATGNGGFAQPVKYSLNGNPQTAAVADFDGDKKLDIAVTNFAGTVVTVLSGHGDGTFAAGVTYTVGMGGLFVAAGDMNGDGHPDLAVLINQNLQVHSISVLMNDGTGHFGNPSTINLTNPTTTQGLAVADFNLDGFVDFAATDITAGQVLVFQSKGDGTFQNPLMVPAGKQLLAIQVADMNSDGKPDLSFILPASVGTILNTSK